MTAATDSASAPTPQPGRDGWARRAATSGLPGAARLGKPAFWILLGLFILAPCACFLALAVSPRLFSEGPQWLTLTYLRQTFTGPTAVAVVNSVWVSSAAAALGLAIGLPIAWLTERTTLPGRRFVALGMWLVLLLPSWLPALGWERIVQDHGVMDRLGLDLPFATHLIMGPSASSCCSGCARSLSRFWP